MSTPRETNLVLRNQTGQRRYVGSVVCRGGVCFFKCAGASAVWLRRSSNALGLNTAVVRHLKDWGIKDVYFNLKDHGVLHATLSTLEKLGTRHAHPGWGFSLNLPLESWEQDRSGFRLGFVPDHMELVLDVAAEWEDEPIGTPPATQEAPPDPKTEALVEQLTLSLT